MKAKDLNLKEGDVVRGCATGPAYDVRMVGGCLCIGWTPVHDCNAEYEIVSRASENPKLWRDMTPEEKGALLLAHHEGKEIEVKIGGLWSVRNPNWHDDVAYRVKPERKVETVTLYNGVENSFDWFLWNKYIDKKHRITFNLIDGEPDCASVKMEKNK